MRQMNRRDLLTAGLGALAIAALAPAASAQDGRELARISTYLNSIDTMTGEFVQIDPDGLLSQGFFFMSRPGRIRFEYEEPNPALVVSDGFWVGVQDKRYGSVDRYPLSETPLNLILKKDVDLGSEGAVRSIRKLDDQMRVMAQDPDYPERGSITMVFGENPLELRQWIVTDAQGGDTTVALSEIKRGVSIEPAQFVIPERGEGTDR